VRSSNNKKDSHAVALGSEKLWSPPISLAEQIGQQPPTIINTPIETAG
jgi:hypothetical protein